MNKNNQIENNELTSLPNMGKKSKMSEVYQTP